MRAQKPQLLSKPVTSEELAATRTYSANLRDFTGSNATLTQAEQLVQSAVNVERNMRAELDLAIEQVQLDPDRHDEWSTRIEEARRRLVKALRDQGRLVEAAELATPQERAKLELGAAALAAPDDNFDCDAGCQDPVIEINGQQRTHTRWQLVKHDIPRFRAGDIPEYVHLWRCTQCGTMNASPLEPPNSLLAAHTQAGNWNELIARPRDDEFLVSVISNAD